MKIAKKRLQRGVMEFKRRFADYPTKALDELLTEESVSQMVEDETGNYRERTYPPLTTLACSSGKPFLRTGRARMP